MGITLNHTIVNSADPETAATWLTEILGLDPPVLASPFWGVRMANDVSLEVVARPYGSGG